MKFSVIVPVYNNVSLLKRCIKSVLIQEYENFELIIIDDGSTDNIQEQVKMFDDKRIVFFRKENGGVSSARNAGIQLATGKFVCFLDSDDEYMPNHLSTLLTLIDKYREAGIYATSHRDLMMDGSIRDSSQYLSPLIGEADDIVTRDGYLLILKAKSDIVHTNSMCIRKSCFNDSCLFPVGESAGEDLYVWYSVMGRNMFAISKQVTTIRHREDSTLSRSMRFKKRPAYIKALKSIIDGEKGISEDVRKHAENLIYRYYVSEANNELLSGNKKNALKILRHIRINKFILRKILRAYFCLLIPSNLLLSFYNKKGNAFYE